MKIRDVLSETKISAEIDEETRHWSKPIDPTKPILVTYYDDETKKVEKTTIRVDYQTRDPVNSVINYFARQGKTVYAINDNRIR